MESILSICFNTESIVSTLIRPSEKGLELVDINVFEGSALSASKIRPESTSFQALERVLSSLEAESLEVRVTFATPIVLSHIVPFVQHRSREELNQLLELEIAENTPHKKPWDYNISSFPLLDTQGNHTQMLIQMWERSTEDLVRERLHAHGFSTIQFVSKHAAMHSALMYNYPERIRQWTMVFCVERDEVVVSVFFQNEMSYFNIIPISSAMSAESMMATILSDSVQAYYQSHNNRLSSILLCGDALQSSVVRELSQLLHDRADVVERLSAFRMCTTSLDEHHRRFASRFAHRFAICVGESLPMHYSALDRVEFA